jgi:curved DNA-binding protein CbpA
MSRPSRRGGNGQSPRSRGWDRSVTPDYYALLNVVPDADREIIRAAYLVLAKRYHPDTATAAFPHNVENFQLLTEAYEVLCDPNRRAHYDRHHARQKRYLAQREEFENARRRAREQAQRRQGERSQEEEQEHQEARARAKSRSPSALRNPLIFSVGGFALAALVFGLIKAPGPNNLATNSDLAMHTEKFEPSSSLLSDKAAQNQELTDLRQALQQAESLTATYQELLAQERARSQALEEQLAARRDATPGRGRNATASPSDTPDPAPAPATDKPATAPLPTSDKPMTQGGDRPATMAGEALTAAASEAAQAKQAAERAAMAEKALPEERARADTLARDLDAAPGKV